jgi:hypothetical protein
MILYDRLRNGYVNLICVFFEDALRHNHFIECSCLYDLLFMFRFHCGVCKYGAQV